MSDPTLEKRRALQRWRLSLGRYSDSQLGASLDGDQTGMDQALDYLYAREYQRRG